MESAQDAANELAGMTLEEQELQKAEWNQVITCDQNAIIAACGGEAVKVICTK